MASKIAQSTPDMFVSELPARDDCHAGVLVELTDGRGASLDFPFVHWRLRRSLEYLLAWADEAT